MRLLIFCLFIAFAMMNSSFSGVNYISASKPAYQDTGHIIRVLARFTGETASPCCCYIYIKERNKFKTVISFKSKQLVNKEFVIEYDGCLGQKFTVGQLYYITARRDLVNNVYQNISTTPSTILSTGL